MQQRTYPGVFISCEGVDASGKTTQLVHLVEHLRSLGYDVVQTREPGGGQNAERIRELFLSQQFQPMTELLLMFASRAEHVATVVIPALEAGKLVVSDRFVDSSYAYQGAGRGMQAEVLALEQLVLKGLKPDYTLFFDLSLEQSRERLARRAQTQVTDHFEDALAEFKERVYNGYGQRLRMDPQRFRTFDASHSVEEVRANVRRWVSFELLRSHPPGISSSNPTN